MPTSKTVSLTLKQVMARLMSPTMLKQQRQKTKEPRRSYRLAIKEAKKRNDWVAVYDYMVKSKCYTAEELMWAATQRYSASSSSINYNKYDIYTDDDGSYYDDYDHMPICNGWRCNC